MSAVEDKAPGGRRHWWLAPSFVIGAVIAVLVIAAALLCRSHFHVNHEHFANNIKHTFNEQAFNYNIHSITS